MTVDGFPSHAVLDRTALLLWEGYRFLSRRRERYDAGIFETRLWGRRTICLVGAEAARLLYDEELFERAGVLPRPVQRTLVGEGGVQGLDGSPHRHRKAMFRDALAGRSLESLTILTGSAWDEAIATWPERDRVVVFDEAARVLLRAGCVWAGVPLPADEVADRARDMVAMVDGFAAAGPRHWRARLARRRSEAWIAGQVVAVRSGTHLPEPGTPLAAIAAHREVDGTLLSEQVAAVEILNLLRPIVAIAWYVTFAMHALQYHPQWRGALTDAVALEHFVQEVRRFYPIAPAVGARVRTDFTWHGCRFRQGRVVLLDVYGTDHDPRRWTDPDVFDPERFLNQPTDPYAFVPQGAGDPERGHRCAGEDVTVALTQQALRRLAPLEYQLPAQDLRIPLDRIPTLPRSGVTLSQVRRRQRAYGSG